jgi:hypothetical protein
MSNKKKTPWQRIMIAANKGVGLRLSAEDVWELSLDDAIATKAWNDDEDELAEPKNYSLENYPWLKV